MIEIIPAIDIIGGRCVRLSKGDYSTRKEYGDPTEMARSFAGGGARRLHLVDLDGAKSSAPENLRTLEAIANLGALKIEWGGGIKSESALRSVMDAGADYAIIGSLAAKQPDTFAGWLEKFGPEHMVLGADVRDGKVSVSGWLEDTALTLEALVSMFPTLSQAVVTDISRDGMLCGADTNFYTELQNRYPSVDFTVSGGISSMNDIRSLDAAGLRKVIVGKAFYEGKITMEELTLWWQNA